MTLENLLLLAQQALSLVLMGLSVYFFVKSIHEDDRKWAQNFLLYAISAAILGLGFANSAFNKHNFSPPPIQIFECPTLERRDTHTIPKLKILVPPDEPITRSCTF